MRSHIPLIVNVSKTICEPFCGKRIGVYHLKFWAYPEYLNYVSIMREVNEFDMAFFDGLGAYKTNSVQARFRWIWMIWKTSDVVI